MLVLWSVVSLVITGIVLFVPTGVTQPLIDLRQSGHWIYHVPQQALFHVDGGTKQVDAKSAQAGAPGGMAVQGGSDVFLAAGSKVIVFGRSTLTVDSSIQVGIDEEPLGIEVAGGPYLVFPKAGTIVRLGRPSATVRVGGPVNGAVATPDGTVWAQRDDRLCFLERATDQVNCDVGVPAGHRGGLSVLGAQLVFLDSSAGKVRTVNRDGLGPEQKLGAALADDVKIASHGISGRIPILDPRANRLLLADGTGAGARPFEVALDPGDYAPPVASLEAVTLLDRSRNRVLTFDAKGSRKSVTPLPSASGKPRISRGQDGRVYVDGQSGEHTIVVDGDGTATTVGIAGDDVPTVQQNPVQPPKVVVPPKPVVNPPKPPANEKARPPGAPTGVNGLPGNSMVTVNWGAAAPNGGAITGYRIAWRVTAGNGSGGETTVAGNQLSSVVNGLRNGTTYVFTVKAQNSAGEGPGADSAAVTPSSEVPGTPGRVTATAVPDGTVEVRWETSDGEGHTITGYEVTAKGADGSTTKAADATTTATTVAKGVLQLGTSYTFTVTAKNELNLSSTASSPSDAVTPYSPAAAPGGLTATPADGTITLAWNAPAVNGGEFAEYLVTANGLPQQRVTAQSARFTGLANGTTYTFQVRARTHEKNRPSGQATDGAPASVTGKPGTPPDVQLVSVNLSGDRQITARVAANDHNSGPVTCQVILNGAEHWRGGCGASSDITIGGLAYATNYDVYVQPSNSYGTGRVSGHIGVRTNDPPPPPPSIAVSKGGPISRADCPSNCFFVHVAMRNFAPNTNYAITCASSVDGNYYTYNRTTNGAGASDSDICYFGFGGKQVWVTAGGVQSNRVTW